MFKIESIKLNHREESQEYHFLKHTFIYGNNSSGKTALTKALNYVLGSSDKTLVYQGLDNIDSYEVLLTNGNTKRWMKRDLSRGFFYKITDKSEYTQVSFEKYKEIIESILSNSDNEIDFKEIYAEVFEEKPTFRVLNFLNFIEEKGLGDLDNVFTKAKNLQNYFRIRDLMRYFFDFQNIKALYDVKKNLKAKEAEFAQYQSEASKKNDIINLQKELFSELSIKYVNSKNDNYKALRNFKNNYLRDSLPNKQDYVYRLKQSLSLAEEIKMYKFMANQNKKMVDRKKRISKLLETFQEISSKSEQYNEYTRFIEEKLTQLRDESIILQSVDYNAIIQEIQNEKEKIDADLKQLKASAGKNSLEDTLAKIGMLEKTFKDFETYNFNEIEELEKEIKELKEKIKDTQKRYNEKVIVDFNQKLTDTYKTFPYDISYVKEDLEKEDFEITFNPFKVVLSIQFKVDGSEQNTRPGSMARQTHMQMLTYLEMFRLLANNFVGFPYLPVLIMDSVNQPMQSDSFSKIYPRILEIADEIGIQTIFLSKEQIAGISADIDISTNGLNPFHDKTK